MDELHEFDRYMAHLSEGLGHADRQAGLRGQMLLRVAQWVVPAMDFSDGGWCGGCDGSDHGVATGARAAAA